MGEAIISRGGQSTPTPKTKIYGYRRERDTESNPDARITYLNDAVGMTPAYTNLSTGVFVPGDWGDFIEEVCRPVMLSTNLSVAYELDRTNFTKKKDGSASDISNDAFSGNAMVEFRKYIWVSRTSDGTYDYVRFSDKKVDSTYEAFAHTNASQIVQDVFWYGAYKGSNINSKLRSLADKSVMVSQTRNTEVSYAQANGAGWYTIDNAKWQFIGDLITLITKSDNSQTKLGSGRVDTSSGLTPGSTKTYGMFWGSNDKTSDVKVFGIEGFWGNYWEGMAGFINDKGVLKVKMTPPYNFDGAGYTNTGAPAPSGTSGGYVSKAMAYGPLGYVPHVASGSDVTYYCDGLWFSNAQNNYALVSATWNSAGLAGSRVVDLDRLPSGTNARIGSRLSATPV